MRIYYDGDSTVWGMECKGGDIVTRPNADRAYDRPFGSLAQPGHDVKPGTGIWEQSDRNEPAVLQTRLNAIFGAGSVIVENHGVPGERLVNSINGTGRYAGANETNTIGPLGSRVAASTATVFVCKFGINDISVGTAVSLFQSHCQTWVDTVQGVPNANGVHGTAVLVFPNPNIQTFNPNMEPYRLAMKAAAEAKNVLFVDHYSFIRNEIPNWMECLPDSVHPNSALYEAMGLHLARQMGPLLAAMG